MSPTITQIISFASKEAVIPRDIFKAGTQRPQSQVIGGGVEKPEAKLWFLEWDQETKSDFEKVLSPLIFEPTQNILVPFGDSLTPCLAAPLTAVTFATTKPNQDLITFGEICNVAMRVTAQQPGCLGTSWGYTKDNPRDLVLLVGWDSMDAHKKFSHTEVFKISSLPYIQGVAKSTTTHYKFQSK